MLSLRGQLMLSRTRCRPFFFPVIPTRCLLGAYSVPSRNYFRRLVRPGYKASFQVYVEFHTNHGRTGKTPLPTCSPGLSPGLNRCSVETISSPLNSCSHDVGLGMLGARLVGGQAGGGDYQATSPAGVSWEDGVVPESAVVRGGRHAANTSSSGWYTTLLILNRPRIEWNRWS